MDIFLIILGIVVFLLITGFVSSDEANAYFPTFLVVVAGAIYIGISKSITFTSFGAFLMANVTNVLIFTGIWIVAGVVWSFFKWWSFLKKEKRRQDAGYIKAAQSETYKQKYPTVGYVIPLAKENKTAIIAWMVYWPFSIVGHLIFDALRNLYNNIYNHLAGTFDKIGASVFK